MYNAPIPPAYPSRVQITDLDIPFFRLVWLIIKVWFASLLAALVVTLVVGLPLFLLSLLVGGLGLLPALLPFFQNMR